MYRFLCWIVTSAALCTVPALAVDPDRAMSQYVRDRWTAEQGFPRGPVYAIAQTPDGYLWIGTEAGLVRFDGLNFRLITDPSGTLPVGSVLGLALDDEGSLWVRMAGTAMLRYRNGTFEDAVSSLGMPFSNVTMLGRASRGGLLISRMEDGALTFHRGRFTVITKAKSPARSPVLSLAQTSAGDIWMGTRDAGLFRLTGNHVSAVTDGLPDTKVNALLPESDGRVWIGTDNGLALWNGSGLTADRLPAALKGFQALALARDRDANIWVGTDSRGLLRVNSHGVSALTSGDEPHEAVTALFEDREGNLWIGSANSIERLRDSAFVSYSPSEQLATDGNIPLFVDDETRLWFPPAAGGLHWLKDGAHGSITPGGSEQDVIYSIAGTEGELWLGRQRGGLTRLRPAGRSFVAKTFTVRDGLAQNSVYSVCQARDRTVWAGTLSGGVSRLQNGHFTTFTTADGLTSNTIVSVAEGSDGTMWFATPAGLSAFAGGRWTSWTAEQGLPSASVNCLLQDRKGVLWAGTASGIAFRTSGNFTSPSNPPAALREQILGIAEDRHGSMWISTSHHVLRVKRDKLLLGALTDGDIREYGIADGLRGTEGVKRHQSVVTDRLGRVWLSMNRGISVVDPRRLAGNSAPAVVQVQTITADGTPMDLRRPVRIPSGRQRITMGFAGLSLSVPERVRFRYSLSGFDHGWSEPVSAREAVYTNLPPGPYRFRVIASNTEGVWNSSEADVAFDIEPAFWQAWWFRLGLVMACVFSILLLYRLRLRQLTRQLSLRFEERLAERTRIAQELHDTLLQGFLSASMQLHVADDRLPADSPAKPLVGRVLGLLGQVIQEGRNAVQGLRSPDNGPQDLGQAFSRIQQELAVSGDVAFRVIVEGQPRPLHPVLRDEVYRIGREALVNAFRHSRATSVEVELGYAPGRLRILVRDNGCGIDPEVLRSGRHGHWGLPGMRERAERIGARIRVMSGVATGTEVELSVPGYLAFQSVPSERPPGWLSKWHLRRQTAAVPAASRGESK